MLGITSSPMTNVSSFKSKIGKKQNVSKAQQPVVDNKETAKPKKKMSKTAKGLIAAGSAVALAAAGFFLGKRVAMIRPRIRISDAEIDALVAEIRGEI